MGSWFSSPSPFIKNPSVYASNVNDKTEPSSIQTYDYVIVGGGPAACVLANRLTNDPMITVLMVEAGKSHKGHLFSRMPAAFAKTFKTDIDWNYTTTAQPNVNNRPMYWPAAKVVGGGSMINALMYQRPCPDDIKEWAKLGATGWDWGDFEKYLMMAEKYTPHPQRPLADASHRGTSGPWTTSHPDCHPLVTKYLDACEQIGIPKIDDISSPEGPIGAMYVSGWIDEKGERNSAAHAYLTPAVLDRPNLTIAVETTVTRVLFSTSSDIPCATGVELAKSSSSPSYQVNARREVLCCAGAIKTPQILMLSGIGPKGELERLNIPVVKELEAVGRNLHDHLMTPVPFRAKPGTTNDSLATPIGGILPMLRWLMTGGGPFGMLTGQVFAFVKSTDTSLPFRMDPSEPVKGVDASAGGASPDLEYIAAPVMFMSHGFVSAPPGESIYTIGTVLLRPQSAGTITLKSSNIWDGADINPNYLALDSDMDTFVRGVRLALRMARSKPLADQLLLKDDVEESDSIYFPGDANPDMVTDDALRRYIKRTTDTLYHPMCTARIGHSPADSVVNHELRVHGVAGLRVIDASVFPAPFPGHTCATVIAVAEKAADILKQTLY